MIDTGFIIGVVLGFMAMLWLAWDMTRPEPPRMDARKRPPEVKWPDIRQLFRK